MDRRYHPLGEWGLDEAAALASDPELPAEQRLSRDRAEADEHPRPHRLQLRVEPPPAGPDLLGVRLLVDASLAARAPLEVLTTFVM